MLHLPLPLPSSRPRVKCRRKKKSRSRWCKVAALVVVALLFDLTAVAVTQPTRGGGTLQVWIADQNPSGSSKEKPDASGMHFANSRVEPSQRSLHAIRFHLPSSVLSSVLKSLTEYWARSRGDQWQAVDQQSVEKPCGFHFKFQISDQFITAGVWLFFFSSLLPVEQIDSVTGAGPPSRQTRLEVKQTSSREKWQFHFSAFQMSMYVYVDGFYFCFFFLLLLLNPSLFVRHYLNADFG